MPRPPLFQRATIARIVRENDLARTFVLEPHGGPFTYRAGQFVTFRVHVNGQELPRSYSMSSAPETDTELMTTVKRVPGGLVSNWLNDNVAEGDEIEVTEPKGVFCLRPTEVPLLGLSGGSGLTPILSLTKSALATTRRQVRLLCADRDRESALFWPVLDDLARQYPGRLSVVHHLDVEKGFADAALIREFVGPDGGADCYICGPQLFMDLVESALPGPGQVFAERFGTAPPDEATDAEETEGSSTGAEIGGTVTIILKNKKVSVPRRAGETLLESARRAGLTPPFSCESGSCATCLAVLEEGTATMRVNDALTEDEVAEGYILTCQGVPASTSVTVRYE